MNRLTDDQVRAGFHLLGLETEEQRAELTRYAQSPRLEERQDFIRLDFATHKPEVAQHAELAQPAQGDQELR